jgi:ABC-type bacteriocin/lantibiotic exporter with double-glycine peptidase domain
MPNQAHRATFRVTFVVSLLWLVGLSAACRLPYTGGARPVGPNELDATWQRAAPTPVVRQEHENDCGLAALAMVAGAWGQHWSLGELQRQLHPSPRGVKLGALRDLARARGLEAYAVRGTHEDLARELENHRPVLLGLILPFDRKNNLAHYEVAVAIDPRDGTVVTRDPATGKLMRRSKKILELEWKPAGYATLVVVGEQPSAGGATGPTASRAGP